jgi:hypothetical protein
MDLGKLQYYIPTQILNSDDFLKSEKTQLRDC